MPNRVPSKDTEEVADVELASELDFEYVSYLESFSSNWDIRLVFGDRLPNGDRRRKVGVVMSHRHAKAFSAVLARQVEALERGFGEIKMEPDTGVLESIAADRKKAARKKRPHKVNAKTKARAS